MTLQRITQRFAQFFRPGPAQEKRRWSKGIHEEVEFWHGYLAGRGADFGNDFAERTDPNFPLQAYLEEVVTVAHGAPLRILDVGAGPLTYVGKRSAHWPVELVAVDPLAAEYDALLARHKVTPPVRTIRADAEKLLDLFPENSFDLVSARNSIDHSYDPMLAIRQMVAVVRPGCPVFIHHAMNEAVRRNWTGLHQWNFGEVDGHFVIDSRTQRIDVTEEMRGIAEVRNRVHGSEWIVTTFLKIGPNSHANPGAAAVV